MSTPKHDDKIHPNRYERAPDERSIYKRYEDAIREIERLEVCMREIQAVTSDIAVVDITDRALCNA